MPTSLEVHRRRQSVAQRALQGLPEFEIAETLNLSPQIVARDLRWLRKAWEAMVRRSQEAKLGEEIARLTEIERQAWTEWFRSREAVGRSTRTTKETEKDQSVQQVVGKTEHLGDVKYLLALVQCLDRRCRLLGITIEKLETPTIMPVEDSPELQALIQKLPDEQLAEVNRVLEFLRDLMEKAGLRPRIVESEAT